MRPASTFSNIQLSNSRADPEKEIEDAFSDSFGKPVIETEGEYSVSVFTGTKDKVTMFYEYQEEKENYNLRYILWEKFEE